MATKKSTKKSSETLPIIASSNSTSKLPTLRFLTSVILVILFGISMFYLAKRYRGMVIAATVNKTPISRWQLNKTLTARYGSAVLEELVNNELITQQAAKEGIVISQEDLKQERTKLVESLGGEDGLSTALSQYGLTEADLNAQLKLRLLQQRLAEKLFKVEVSDDDIKKYFETNTTIYKDKKLDDVKAEIKESLYQQRIQQEFFAWFEQLKKDSRISIYIQEK